MASTTFIAATGNGLARASCDAQGAWSVVDMLRDQDVRCLAADPHNSQVVYAGTQGSGVLRSNDGGQTWQPAGLSGQVVKALTVSRAEPRTVYAGTKPPRLLVSRDAGTSWKELDALQRMRRWFWFSPAETPFTAYIQSIGLSPVDPHVIVVGIEAGAVIRSVDGGQTWTGHQKGAVRDCHSLSFHAINGDWVYEAGGTGAGAAFSQDTGQTWSQPRAGLDRHYGWASAADPERPDIWYVSASPFSWSGIPPAHIDGKANAYIFRSMNGGAWQKLTGGLPEPLNYMAYALVTDPAAPRHLYAGLSSGDVWHSPDYGDSWEKLPFQFKGIHRVLIKV